MTELTTPAMAGLLGLGLDYGGAGTVTLGVAGELDAFNAEQLREALRSLFADPDTTIVVVDLSRLEYLDSTGVGVLLGAGRQAAGRGTTLRVVNAYGLVARVFEVLRLRQFLAQR